jgi:hypothetical protein
MIEAGLRPKVKELAPLKVVTDFVAIITTAYTIAGQKPDDATLALYADELYNKLMETYPAITIDEVRAALRAGVYGEYGKYYGLNPQSFMLFIDAYIHSEERAEAKKEFDRKRLELIYKSELTPAEKDRDNKEFVNFIYTDFLKGILLTDFIPAYVFDFLEESKVLVLTVEQRLAISERAKAYYTRFVSNQKTKGRIGIEITGFLGNSDPKLIVRILSKQFAVNDFFEQCKAEGKEIIFPGPKLLTE